MKKLLYQWWKNDPNSKAYPLAFPPSYATMRHSSSPTYASLQRYTIMYMPRSP